MVKRIDGIYKRAKTTLQKPENKRRLTLGTVVLTIVAIIVSLVISFFPDKNVQASPGTRTKTVEFFVGQYYGTGIASTTVTNYDFTVYLPDAITSATVVRSAYIEYNTLIDGTNDASATDFQLGVVGSLTSLSAPDVIDQTGESTPVQMKLDATAKLQSIIQASGTFNLRFSTAITGPVHYGESAKLMITYDYNDAAATQVKTVYAWVHSQAATVASGGTVTSAIFNLSLPESTITSRSAWIETRGYVNAALNTGFYWNSETERDITWLNTTNSYGFVALVSPTNTYSPNTNNTFTIKSVSGAFSAPSAILGYTYSFDYSASTELMNSLKILLYQGTETASTATLSGNKVINIPEATITGKSAFLLGRAVQTNTAARTLGMNALRGSAPGSSTAINFNANAGETCGFTTILADVTSNLSALANGDNTIYWRYDSSGVANIRGLTLYLNYKYNKASSSTFNFQAEYHVGQQTVASTTWSQNFTPSIADSTYTLKQSFLNHQFNENATTVPTATIGITTTAAYAFLGTGENDMGEVWRDTSSDVTALGSSLTATLNNDKSSTKSASFLVWWQYTKAVSYTQNYYRFYVDNDLVQPSDPWPVGATDLAQNTPITTSDTPPDDNDLVRIRMSVQIGELALGANTQAFKLQYAERADGVCASATGWAAVGAAGSATIWRGESDTTPADGTTLTSTLLTPSDTVESYEEQNNSVNNPNGIVVGNDGEWDWLIQNNGAAHDTTYCFRMVKSDDTAFATYTNYPKISTELTTFSSSFEGGNGASFTKPYSDSSTKVSFNSELDGGTSDPICTAVQKQNWFYFSMNNALNQSIEFTLIDAIVNNNEWSNWTDVKPIYSYDQSTWYRVSTVGTLSGNNFVFTAPGGGANFTSDTVYIAYNLPYTYSNYTTDLTTWQASSYVTTTNIGNSVQGRAMHLLTIQDTNSPMAAANKKVYWFIARQHPAETPGSYGIKGAIDFLTGSSDEAKIMRRSSIFKIIPMMNPDGAYQGWTRSNAQLCNLNAEWVSTGANASTEATEVYNTHYAIDNWMSSGTPADAEVFSDYHSQSPAPNAEVFDGNTAMDGNVENPYEVLFNVLDGNPHTTEFGASSTAGLFNVEIYTQYNVSKGSVSFTLEAPNIKFNTDYPTAQNTNAYGTAFLKTLFTQHETNAKVFGLATTDAGGSTDPGYFVVSAPSQYHAIFNEDTGGGIYNWYDRENDPNLLTQLVDASRNLDEIAWIDGAVTRNSSDTLNATLTVLSNSGTRIRFKYTGQWENVSGYDFVYERVVGEDGRFWTNWDFTNNTAGGIDWGAENQQVSVEYALDTSFGFQYDNTVDPPVLGTDRWWGLVGNGTAGVKATAISHYVGQTNWAYDDYSFTNDTAGKRNYYRVADGPIQGTGAANAIKIYLSYQIRPDNDLLGTEVQIDAYRNDIANPDTPTMITGTFTEFNKQEGGLKFAASGNNVKFTYTNAATYTKKKPVYVFTNYTATTAPVLKVNNAFLDSETGAAHPTGTHIGASYTSYVDTVNSIAYVQYLNDISTNINVEIKDSFAGNTAPNSPSSLVQKKTDDTVIAQAGWTNETSVKYTATASDPDNPDTLYLCVEKDPIGTVFLGTEDACGTGVAYSGTPVTVTLTIASQTDNTEYHWQARVKDAANAYSSWVSYGTNTDPNDRDYGLDTTAPTGGTVYDGTSGDQDWNDGSLTQLSGNWTGFDATVSGLNKYEYALRRKPDDNYWSVCSGAGAWQAGANWCDNATGTSFTQNNLNLQTGVIYYVSVRATDNASNTASPVNSNGQQVSPTLSFTLSGNTIDFADLNNSNSWTDSKTGTVTTSTNASAGYTVSAYLTQLLTSLAYPSQTIANFYGTWFNPEPWPGGTYGFGYTSSDTLVQGSNRFNNATEYAAFSQTASGDVAADHTDAVNGSTGAVVNEQFTITYKVAVSTTQVASTYRTYAVYVVTANY